MKKSRKRKSSARLRQSSGGQASPPVAAAGDWVEISAVLLAPDERSPNLPTETAAVPLVMRVRGWAQKGGKLGAKISVRTQAGRVLTGMLLAVNPRFGHDFGDSVPELIEVRRRLKVEMSGGGAP